MNAFAVHLAYEFRTGAVREQLLGLTSYTIGMKTAVSIPDEVFDEAEKLRRQLDTSRSELYSNALREYVARHGSDSVTEALNELHGESPPDTDLSEAAAKRTLRRSEW
jgi:hypothetical protein